NTHSIVPRSCGYACARCTVHISRKRRRIGIAVVEIEIVAQISPVVRRQVRVRILEPIIDNRQSNPLSGRQVPGLLHARIDARRPATLASVLQVPLLTEKWVIRDEAAALLPRELW